MQSGDHFEFNNLPRADWNTLDDLLRERTARWFTVIYADVTYRLQVPMMESVQIVYPST